MLAPGGGFVCTTIHNVQADVPPENFWAYRDAVAEYSGY
jgi:uroporphyrinogen decarboxylase